MGLSGCYCLMKYLLVFVNLIFWLVGILIVALAAWMIADPTCCLSMTQDESKFYLGLYVFLGAGALLVLVAFLGVCGSIRESRCMLVMFFCMVLIGVVGEAACVWWGVEHSGQLQQQVRATVEATVRSEYDGENTRTAALDAIQRGFECCGANGPQDWSDSRYSQLADEGSVLGKAGQLSLGAGLRSQRPFTMPPSCCREEGEVCDGNRRTLVTAQFHSIIYKTGCVDKVMSCISDYVDIFIGSGIAMAGLEILSLLFALILCFAINNTDRYKA